MQNSNQQILISMGINLSTFEEQKRIVAEIDGCTTLCDEPEASSTRAQSESRRFMDAIMVEIRSHKK